LFGFRNRLVALVTHASVAGSYVRPAMSRRDPERGQATVEWIGLVLGVALLLGAVAAGGREVVKGETADGLGEAVAERIVCAAKGACGAGAGGERLDGPPGGRLGGVPRGGSGGRLGVLGGAPGGAPRRPSPPAPSGQAGIGQGVAKRAWFLCLGYRRWQYDREHAPFQRVPLKETVKTVNECVNPLSFLFG
jgi:hypothetical protein